MASSPDLFLDRMAQNTANSPNKTAVTFLSSGPNGGKVERSLTYSELAKATTSLASRLLESGLSKGDRAVLVYAPSLDYMVAFLACLKAGIVAVPVFPPNPVRQETLLMFSRIVHGCGATHALTSVTYNYTKKLASIGKRKQWPSHLHWMVTNDGKSPTKIFEERPPSSDDLAFLQYTSGSTSDPKGVMITHGNLAHNLTIITQELCAKEDTVVVSWLPQYHDMGLIGSYLGVLYCGGSGYYMSPLSFLQRPMLWMEAVSKYHATHLQAPNFAFKLTARKSTPEKLDLSSVRHIINGAEPVDENSMDSFYKAFGKFGLKDHVIFPTYGLAEHTVFVCSGGKQRLSVSKLALEVDGLVKVVENDGSNSNSNSSDISRLVGCGYPGRQGVDVKIVNTDTHEVLDDDAVGEIWIQSPSKAAGYFDKPEQSNEDFHAHLKGRQVTDGYLRSGDLGFLHNEELFICGRLKDLIIVGGRNYYPQDIEATAEATSELLRPGCSAAFTIDPTHEGGEEVALVAELREISDDKKKLDEVCISLAESIRSAVNQENSLGLSQLVLVRPRTVPKTSSGKIARALCRKAFISETLDVVYRKSFKTSGSLEIEQTPTPSPTLNPDQMEALRAMDREQILTKLSNDVTKLGSVPVESIDVNASLVSILDSLTISQFKGLLEAEYAVTISDEYLFRENTTLSKLVEVVKLGHALDDGEGDAPVATTPSSNTGGLAGALGCPPGVVCCVVM